MTTGLLYFLGFPGVGWWPVAFVSLTPLILAVRDRPPLSAFVLGWIAGTLANLLGFYWLYSAQTVSGLSAWQCSPLVIALCAWQGGRLGMMCFYARATKQVGPARALNWAVALAVSELARPVVFPWYLGAALHNVIAMMQPAELGDPCLVSIVHKGDDAIAQGGGPTVKTRGVAGLGCARTQSERVRCA